MFASAAAESNEAGRHGSGKMEEQHLNGRDPLHHLKVLALKSHEPSEIRNKVSFLVKCDCCWFNRGVDKNPQSTSDWFKHFSILLYHRQTVRNLPFLHVSQPLKVHLLTLSSHSPSGPSTLEIGSDFCDPSSTDTDLSPCQHPQASHKLSHSL